MWTEKHRRAWLADGARKFHEKIQTCENEAVKLENPGYIYFERKLKDIRDDCGESGLMNEMDLLVIQTGLSHILFEAIMLPAEKSLKKVAEIEKVVEKSESLTSAHVLISEVVSDAIRGKLFDTQDERWVGGKNIHRAGTFAKCARDCHEKIEMCDDGIVKLANTGYVYFERKLKNIMDADGRSGLMDGTDLLIIQTGLSHILLEATILPAGGFFETARASRTNAYALMSEAVSDAVHGELFDIQNEKQIGKER